MSRCFYLKSEECIDFIGLQETLEGLFCDGYTVKVDKYEPSEGEGGCFYIEGNAARGVQVFHEDGSIVVKINTLCNYPDYILAKAIITIVGDFLKKQFTDEEDKVIVPHAYFSDENIRKSMEDDAMTFLAALKTVVKDTMQIFGVVRKVYFGKGLTKILSKYEEDPKTLVNVIESIIHHVQYELPDYVMPGAALIRPKDSEDEKDSKKIRMMFEGNAYILQDYDYLLVQADEKSKEIIFIDNADVSEIALQLFKKDSGFEFADDFTMVFPKLEGENWKKFVDLAREKNHKELLEAQPAAETVDLTPDYDSKSDEENEHSCQCHGDHWDCILGDKKDEFATYITTSIEKGTAYGDSECDYVLGEKMHGKVAIIEYDGGSADAPIVIRNVIAMNRGQMELVSGFPVVRNGTLIPLKVTEIKEWQNGLEAWIQGELADGRSITFFDADYAIRKGTYVIGRTYDFVIGALAYRAKEPESKGFSFEGQQAVDFKAKLGEKPEYDESGNVKPIHFSTEELCALFQACHAPDDAEYITTVGKIKSENALEKSFWKFDVIYRDSEGDEEKIPTFVLKTEENASLEKAPQIQGLLWLTGYLSKSDDYLR